MMKDILLTVVLLLSVVEEALLSSLPAIHGKSEDFA